MYCYDDDKNMRSVLIGAVQHFKEQNKTNVTKEEKFYSIDTIKFYKFNSLNITHKT